MAGLELAGVHKAYGDVEVLRGLDLDAEEGELLVVLGPSGSGKTTMLRVVAGLEEPTQGTVRIAGDEVTHVPASRRNVAMVFQSYALFPHLDAGHNIGFGLWARGMARKEVDERVRAAAARVGIVDLLHRRPHELSGGERQSVALARALARDPEVFLLDEPLSNLDAQLRTKTRAELKALHAELGRTMVYVTHDQAEALTLGDRIAVLERGVVAQVGTPDEVYRRPADRFVASFVGSPAMNFLPAEAAARFGLPQDGEVGVRPEHVRLGEGEVEARWPSSSRPAARARPRRRGRRPARRAGAARGAPGGRSTHAGDDPADRCPSVRPGREQARVSEPRALGLMLAPYLLGLALLVFAPAVITFGLALFRYDLITSPEWAGLANFRELWDDDLFRRSIRNSLMFVAAAVPLRLLGALLLALLLHRQFRGASTYRAVTYMPTVIPDVAFALLMLWVFNPLYGPLNLALDSAGFTPPQWLTDPSDARWAVVWMSLFTIGEGFVIALAVRQSLPGDSTSSPTSRARRPGTSSAA